MFLFFCQLCHERTNKSTQRYWYLFIGSYNLCDLQQLRLLYWLCHSLIKSSPNDQQHYLFEWIGLNISFLNSFPLRHAFMSCFDEESCRKSFDFACAHSLGDGKWKMKWQQNLHFYSTFNEVDGLLEPVGVLVAVIKNVSSKLDPSDPLASSPHYAVDVIDGIEHRLQCLKPKKVAFVKSNQFECDLMMQ